MTFKVVEPFKGAVQDVVSVDFLGAYHCPGREQLKEHVPDLAFLVFAHHADHHRLAVELCWGVIGRSAVPELVSELRARRASGARALGEQ